MHEKNDPDIWTRASDRYQRRKLRELIEAWQRDQKAQGLPWKLEDLAQKLYCHRNTVSKWINGKAKLPIDQLCDFFDVDPSYFVAKDLNELDLVDEPHHKWMQEGASRLANECGVSTGFLWYLKSDQQIQDTIVENQPTDAVLNSFDHDVPDVGSPYQFIHSSGEKIYLNEYTMPMLGRIEPKVKDFIEYQLWSELKKKDQE